MNQQKRKTRQCPGCINGKVFSDGLSKQKPNAAGIIVCPDCHFQDILNTTMNRITNARN